ncbi:MAG: hypothetical protein L6U16_00530 [Porphyromonadaceae bacterium]|nr:MAG: hypothetical protein L6U16_00530 [Porphyromonadaceae bacterium]
MIERNIGYSKEFNIFELEDAIVSRNQLKAFRIVDYFQKKIRKKQSAYSCAGQFV